MRYSKKKKKNFKMQYEFSDRCSKHVALWGSWVRQRYLVTDIGLQLARRAILAAR